MQTLLGAFPHSSLFACVGDLGPNEDSPLVGTWQVAFLGEIEPRAAPTRKHAPASKASRPTPAAAVNKTRQRIPLSQGGPFRFDFCLTAT